MHLEEKLAMEIEQFKQRDPIVFWDNSTSTFRSVYLDILCSMQDQPERRSGLGLMMGNSRMFPRFGYSCNYLSIKSSLRSCTECEVQLHSAVSSEEICEKCLNWGLNPANKLCHFKAPDNYPSDCPYLLDENKLSPKKLCNDFLVLIVTNSAQKLREGIWNKKM